MKVFSIEKAVEIKASAERIFSALTDGDEIPKYFPLKSVESAWEIGGEVLYRGEVNGNPFTDYGVIEKLSFPYAYQYRYWSDNHGTERVDENYLTIAYSLKELPEGTLLSVRQGNIKSPELYELMNNQVWDFLLGSLKEYVESRT